MHLRLQRGSLMANASRSAGSAVSACTTRPPRTRRNPKSGEEVQVPAKCVPHFKVGKELREWKTIHYVLAAEYLQSIKD